MSYSLLAMLPPVSGLYSSVFAAFAHLAFGINPFQSIGPFALVSLLSGEASLGLAMTLKEIKHGNNLLVSRGEASPWESYPFLVPISDILCLMVSIILLLILSTGIGRRIKLILPENLIKGFSIAAALSIVNSQLKLVLGITIAPITGTFIIIRTCIAIISSINQFQPMTFIICGSTVILTLILDYLTKWKNWTILNSRHYNILESSNNGRIDSEYLNTNNSSNFPTMLVSLAIMTCISHYGGLEEKYSISVIGKIPSGVPGYNSPIRIFSLIDDPSMIATIISNIVLNGLAISLVIYVTLLSVTQTFPSPLVSKRVDLRARAAAINLNTDENIPDRMPVDSEFFQTEYLENSNEEDQVQSLENQIRNNNQIHVLVQSQEVRRRNFLREWEEEDHELLSISAASFLCSCFSGFVASPSLSRSSILATQTNSKSPLANFIASIFVIITVFFLADLLYSVPVTCLAGIIIASLQSTIRKLLEFKNLLKAVQEKRGWKQWYDLLLFAGTFSAVVIFDPCTGIIIGMSIAIIWNILKYLYK